MNASNLIRPKPLSGQSCIPAHGQWPGVQDIVMIRGDGTYSWLFLRNGEQRFTSRTVKYWMKRFNSVALVRVHRSYAVHREQVRHVALDDMCLRMAGGLRVTIARSKRKLVMELLCQ